MQKPWHGVGVQSLQGCVADPLTNPIPRKVLGIRFHHDGKGVKMQLGYLVSLNHFFFMLEWFKVRDCLCSSACCPSKTSTHALPNMCLVQLALAAKGLRLC